jgi:hypothetical protein
MVPENWALIGKGKDEETGLPMVLVAREKHDPVLRLTIWKLLNRDGSWYSVGQWISKGLYRRFPEPNGVKLSDSYIDQKLLEYANDAWTD